MLRKITFVIFHVALAGREPTNYSGYLPAGK